LFREKVYIHRLIISTFVTSLMGTIVSLVLIRVWIKFIVIYPLISITMILIAFGYTSIQEVFKKIIILYMVTFSLGGFINSVYYNINIKGLNFRVLLLLLIIVIPLIKLLKMLLKNYSGKKNILYDVELVFSGKSIITKGLLDTGNSLYDSYNKKPVIIVKAKIIEDIIDSDLKADIENIINNIKNTKGMININNDYSIKDKNIVKLRIVPYQSIGTNRGCLLGIVLDEVNIYKDDKIYNHVKITAGIYDNEISINNEYQVILHRELL
ncbi:MAG TPA: sigma-E processing peptidase SpoIIGA, partial [Clostridiales bacterium]|nr:sigma-E processing peptidase SpoIIGA [Clostridiales bacterium]